MADSNLDLIVDVQVSRDVQPFSGLDFNAVLFISDEQVFSERVRQYSRTADLLTDGFSEDSKTYKAVRSYFSQSPRPRQIAVGRRDATVAAFSMTTAQVANSTAYSMTLMGKTITYTSASNATDDAAAEIELIIDGLQALAAADSDITAGLTPTSAGVGAAAVLTLTEVADMTIAYDASQFSVAWTQETWADAIANVSNEYDSWYALATYDHSVAGVLAIAAEVEALNRIYICSNQHADNIGVQAVPAGANDLLGQLEELNLDRTAFVYSATADETYIESAYLGDKMTTVPGRTTWDLSGVAGVVADKLTRTQINNINSKKGNFFTTFGGVDYIREGRMVSGEWIDTIRGADNMALDLQKELARIIASANNAGRKIPLTDAGVAILKDAAAAIVEQYVERGFIVDTIIEQDANGNKTSRRGYTVSAALVSSLTTTQKANREAPTIQIVAYLAGAVHHAKVLVNLFV